MGVHIYSEAFVHVVANALKKWKLGSLYQGKKPITPSNQVVGNRRDSSFRRVPTFLHRTRGKHTNRLARP